MSDTETNTFWISVKKHIPKKMKFHYGSNNLKYNIIFYIK